MTAPRVLRQIAGPWTTDEIAQRVIGETPITARELARLRKLTQVASCDFRGVTIASAVIRRLIQIAETQESKP